MATSSYSDEQSTPRDHHSIRVFTRPFLEYSTSYPSPLEGYPAPEGARPDIVCHLRKISSSASIGYWLRIAAMRHKGGYVPVGGMRLLELCASLVPEEAIHISVSYVAGGKAYLKEWESAYLAREVPVFSRSGFIMPGKELH